MHCREHIELAALIVSQATTLLAPAYMLPESGLQVFWTNSKCRQDRWGRAFQAYRGQASGATSHGQREAWSIIRPVIEEVLASEVLTRIWAAVLCQRDQHLPAAHAGPIARSVFVGHLDARNRALNAMVYGHGFSIMEAIELNRQRRRYEHWIDLLLAALQPRCCIDEFAIDARRAHQFSADLEYQGSELTGSSAWQWMRALLRLSVVQQRNERSPNSDLNERIAASILSCLSEQASATPDGMSSPWLQRLSRAMTDVQGDVDSLLFEGTHRRSTATTRFDVRSKGPRSPRW